jgi:hypothetical protein
MDPAPQGSFIPKQSLSAVSRGSSVGLLFVIALFIFLLSLLAAGAAFGYERLLMGRLASKNADLRKAEGAFNPGTIQDLVRTDHRINEAGLLLNQHVAPSALFSFLSTITLERVQLSGFEFNLGKDASSIAVEGSADSLQSVALQSDQFGMSKSLRDVVFGGIVVSGETGKVNFTVTATIDPSLISYAKSLEGTGVIPVTTIPTPDTTSPTPPTVPVP